MTTEENRIMADMFYFLRDHANPPLAGDKASMVFWEKTAKDISELVDAKWKSHPLAMALGMALYGYLEQKARKAGGDTT